MIVVFGFPNYFNFPTYQVDVLDEERIFIDLYEKMLFKIQRNENGFELASFKFSYSSSLVTSNGFPHGLISEQITVVDGRRRLNIDRVQQVTRVMTFKEYYVITASSQKVLKVMPAMINIML